MKNNTPTPSTKRTIKKYGEQVCREAFAMHEEGNGASTVAHSFTILGGYTNAGDAAINAGRELAEKQDTTPAGNKFANKVQNATLIDALAWSASNEKTMFCIEFLEAFSINQIDSFWQDELEDRFESLIEAGNHN